MKTFYITTAIDYVNAKPHIGHAYEKIITDVIARWHRLRGEDVCYLTGTDENAQKNVEAAKAAGKDVKAFVDENVTYFKELCKTLNISNDEFVRTTEDRHTIFCQKLFTKLHEKKDIYKGFYEGLYCNGCEAYFSEKDLIEGKCPEHQKEPEWIKQESYFFKMGDYEKDVLKLLESDSFVVPEGKKKEMINRIKTEGLKDLCVSRYKAEWGIDVPFDKDHKLYVWFDAISTYISGLDYPNEKFKTYWPAVHVIGKGINWFHSVIWPSMLIAGGIEPPKQVLVHGYLTVNGEKLSKSLGNAIDTDKLVEKYGVDPVRYFLVREIPLWSDGDFNEEALTSRLNNELANDLGNLLSRTVALCNKHFEGNIPKGVFDKEVGKALDIKKIDTLMETYELSEALSEIWKFINVLNKYVSDKKPWEQEEGREDVLYTLLEGLRVASILLSPFIPGTSDKINAALGVEAGTLKDTSFGKLDTGKLNKQGHLFKKIE